MKKARKGRPKVEDGFTLAISVRTRPEYMKRLRAKADSKFQSVNARINELIHNDIYLNP